MLYAAAWLLLKAYFANSSSCCQNASMPSSVAPRDLNPSTNFPLAACNSSRCFFSGIICQAFYPDILELMISSIHPSGDTTSQFWSSLAYTFAPQISARGTGLSWVHYSLMNEDQYQRVTVLNFFRG